MPTVIQDHAEDGACQMCVTQPECAVMESTEMGTSRNSGRDRAHVRVDGGAEEDGVGSYDIHDCLHCVSLSTYLS